jgi:uracil-DNA glycosylase family 4
VVRPVDVLLEFLRAQQARGLSHLHLDPEARTGLRALNDCARAGRKPAPSTHSDGTTGVPPVTDDSASRISDGKTGFQPVREDSASSLSANETTGLTPVREACPPPAKPPMTSRLAITGDSLEAKLASLREQAETWGPARSLGTLRDVMVFAVGDPTSRVMLIGEAPGHDEEKKREPFVGPAGQKLDQILLAMGLSRSAVYISNIVKFRPATARQTTNNRPPSPAEIAACLPIIQAEIDLIQPACLIALGGTAATGLLDTTASVTALRGQWHSYQGIPLRVTYHPSYLLRSAQDNATKRLVWEDMLAAMEQLGLPISERQQRFFLPAS